MKQKTNDVRRFNMADANEIYELAFEAVETAKKTGKLKKGTNEVTKAVEKGAAKLVVVATDVNPKEIVMHLKPLCKEKGILYAEVGKKDELGAAAGMAVGTSAVAIVNEGEGEGIIKKLAEALKE